MKTRLVWILKKILSLYYFAFMCSFVYYSTKKSINACIDFPEIANWCILYLCFNAIQILMIVLIYLKKEIATYIFISFVLCEVILPSAIIFVLGIKEHLRDALYISLIGLWAFLTCLGMMFKARKQALEKKNTGFSWSQW